jgi:hypothetical protein
MAKILCATRGGEASYRTQDAAVALAKERGDELVFLFVADISFLNQTAAPLVVDIASGQDGQVPIDDCPGTGQRAGT